MTRRTGGRGARGGSTNRLRFLDTQVRNVAYSRFGAEWYTVDGVSGKVASWTERSLHPSGILSIDASHKMEQATSAQQCAIPTADSLFNGRVSAAFADQRYTSHASASAWRCLHDGTGCAVYNVLSYSNLTGAKYVLATTSGGTAVGFNTGTSGAALAAAVLNVGAVIGAPSGGTLTTSTAYYTRYRYEENVSPEIDIFAKTTSMNTIPSTSGAPSTGDPTATLMLGNRQAVNAPFVGNWLETIVIKGSYSATIDALIKSYFAAKYGVI